VDLNRTSEVAMADAEYFREKAQRCRVLLRTAVRPEVVEQLRRWVDDFEEEAEAVERRERRRLRVERE
jgi:hypothetical protein